MDMKKFIYTIPAALLTLLSASSCADLNLNPLAEASSENWYQNADQITMSLNDLYRSAFYGLESEYWTDRRTDDWAQRDQVYELVNGSATSATGAFEIFWDNTYKAISRANRVIEAVENLGDGDMYAALKAEAYFFRAFMYARLVICWGDVPFYTTDISVEEAYDMGRTDKEIIKKQVIEDFDAAIAGLPEDNSSGGVIRVDKGTALACKARAVLTWGDYETCAALCKEVMDMKKYSLFEDYGQLFREKAYTCETIWALPNSYAFEQYQSIKSWVLRTAGGTGVAQPSWDLLAAYECTDGKTIDESPLFDPHDPYSNRDPRCAETFVVPGTAVYGVVFNPHPDVTSVLKDGVEVTNKDNKTKKNPYAPYNGCCLRKGAQEEWRTGQYNENPITIIRYADVLLMYAEALIELDRIDDTALNAINDVRARAYGVKRDDTASYPEVTTKDRTELRRILRRERRVEFAWEGRRLFDLKRWGLLEKAYSHHYYGLLNAEGLKGYISAGNWFWPYAPELDEDGFADFTKMENEGIIARYGLHKYDPKCELFPIPNAEMLINDNLVQNPGY
jgi:starch-binding outer membrane protein, SusD/RagB family